MAMHHPFTLPKAEDLDKVESDPGACHAVAYDIVLNGVEMGGGSMRINDPALQDRMFHALGFTEEKARESFGFLMDAYKFGAPPHGGMAYGLDRMVMLMLKKDSIRDVIAFPKVQNAGEPMSGAAQGSEHRADAEGLRRSRYHAATVRQPERSRPLPTNCHIRMLCREES